ncbi:MAG TPA: lysylphosphatidylglycerol synthase domain-containing protein [Gaiellaceae bacterium]|nr:lysylphosphatidylglycerol synthase domain-containing protein [Gaiellaceae bacterium]
MTAAAGPGRARAAVFVGLLLALAGLTAWRADDALALVAALASVSWPWACAAVAVNVLSVLVRSAAWASLLRRAVPDPPPPRRRIATAFSIAVLANALLPGRAGEVARVVVVSRYVRRRGGWATIAGSMAAHRALDAVPFAALVAFVLASLAVPGPTALAAALLALLGAAFLAVSVALAPRGATVARRLGAVGRLLASARQGLAGLATPRAVAPAASLEACGWACEALGVFFLLRAFGIDVPLLGVALVLLATSLATAFPLWPGNVGVFQVAVAFALGLLGVAYTSGLAFAVGLHAVEVLSAVALGVPALAYEGMSFSSLRRMTRSTRTALAAGRPGARA